MRQLVNISLAGGAQGDGKKSWEERKKNCTNEWFDLFTERVLCIGGFPQMHSCTVAGFLLQRFHLSRHKSRKLLSLSLLWVFSSSIWRTVLPRSRFNFLYDPHLLPFTIHHRELGQTCYMNVMFSTNEANSILQYVDSPHCFGIANPERWQESNCLPTQRCDLNKHFIIVDVIMYFERLCYSL